MTPREKETLAFLLKLNEGQPDSLNGCEINCEDVKCYECPLRLHNDVTLGELRSIDINVEDAAQPEEEIEGVTNPTHYQLFKGIEAIEVIARSMTVEMFRGFCFGNVLKYRLRAGKKSELAYAEKDLAKADFYKELFEDLKDRCYDFKTK